jgi:hypothetical protein
MSQSLTELNKFFTGKGLEEINFNGVTHAWGYRDNEPVFALIKNKDGNVAFQNAMSLYWSSAEYITKPWCLVLVVDVIELHHRQMLENLSTQYNIQIIENPDDLLPIVIVQLDRLTEILSHYIPAESNNKSRALGESISKWRSEKPVYKKKFRVEIMIGNLDIYKESGILAPSRRTVPLTATAGSISIKGVLPRLVGADEGLLFDTEHRNLPMVYQLFLGENMSLLLRFEADKSNLIEATCFWSLYSGFLSTNKLSFIEPNTGDMLFSCVREHYG